MSQRWLLLLYGFFSAALHSDRKPNTLQFFSSDNTATPNQQPHTNAATGDRPRFAQRSKRETSQGKQSMEALSEAEERQMLEHHKQEFAPIMNLPSLWGYPIASPELIHTSPQAYNQPAWARSRRPAGLRPGYTGNPWIEQDAFETCEDHDGVCVDCFQDSNFGNGGADCPPNTPGRPCHTNGYIGVFEKGFCPNLGNMCCVRPNDDICQAVGGLCVKLPSNLTDETADGLPCRISAAGKTAIPGFYMSSSCPSKQGFSCCRPPNDNLCRAVLGRCSSCPLKNGDGSCYAVPAGAPDEFRNMAGNVCPKRRTAGNIVGGVFVPGLCPSATGFMCCTEVPDANPLAFDWENNFKTTANQYNDPKCAKVSGKCTPCTNTNAFGGCDPLTTGQPCQQQLEHGHSRAGVFKAGYCTNWPGMMCCVSNMGPAKKGEKVADKCLAEGGWCQPCPNLVAGVCFVNDKSACTMSVPGQIPVPGMFKEGLCTKIGQMCCVPLAQTNVNALHPANTLAFKEMENEDRGQEDARGAVQDEDVSEMNREQFLRNQNLQGKVQDEDVSEMNREQLLRNQNLPAEMEGNDISLLETQPPVNDQGCFVAGGWCMDCPDTFAGICRNTQTPCDMKMSPSDPVTVGKWKEGLCRGAGIMCCISDFAHPGNPYSGPRNGNGGNNTCKDQDGVCMPSGVAGQPCRAEGFVGFLVMGLCPAPALCCIRPNDEECQAMGGKCVKKVDPVDSCVISGIANKVVGQYRPGLCPTKQGFSCCTPPIHPYCAAVGGRCVPCPELAIDGTCSAQMVGRACPVMSSGNGPVLNGRFARDLCPDTPGFMCCTAFKVPQTMALSFFKPAAEMV